MSRRIRIALVSFWRSLVCLVHGHKLVQGQPVFASAILQVHQISGRTVQRPVNTRTTAVVCARCGVVLSHHLAIVE